MVWELVGYLAGFLIAIALTPQLIKTWKTKSAKDVSLLWTFTLLIGVILYVIYGAKNLIMPVLIFSTIESIMVISLIVMKIMYDRTK